MSTIEKTEARILETQNVLVVLSDIADEQLLRDFCGSVITDGGASAGSQEVSGKTVYLCGDISRAKELDLSSVERVFIIREHSRGYEEDARGTFSLVDVGRVPVRVHGVGVYFRRFFDSELDYFQRISSEHTFQSLTESTKPAKAHRTGIYLTPVHKEGDELHFHLLRCSTNLAGPSENFRAGDTHIVDSLNQEAARLFEHQAPLNHVLAQIYHNTPASAEHKQTKAKISAHADKTKDMPVNGIMAFCTFYQGLDKLQPLKQDPFDYGHKGKSGLTRLQFRLKASVTRAPSDALPDEFSVTLYPNSVFFMPLSTNRLYTHEIQSSILDAEMLPTRLGYVVRCSKTKAVHTNGQTFLEKNETRVPLEPPTPEGMLELRRLYAEENKTHDFIDYGDQFRFSMNQGDYVAPVYHAADEFRVYTLSVWDKHFDELRESIRFEQVGKGRLGTVLVRPNEAGHVPLVRTTTPYTVAPCCFRPVHERLARLIQKSASLGREFNNALIEVYTNEYTSMGSHSDLALDLAEESHIALFSHYKFPDQAKPLRKLVVESKLPGGETFEIPLAHNSVVVFSVATNRRFRHKIVLERTAKTPENEWLGITFRTAKTFVRFDEEAACFADGTRLMLASDDERRAFFRMRRRENAELDFGYSSPTYTLSESDRMRPDGI